MTLDIERLLQIPEGEELISLDEWKKFWRERARNKRDGYPAVAGLDQWHPGWWLPTKTLFSWVSKTHQLAAFVSEHGSWPRQQARDDHEKMLGRFLDVQRRAKKGQGTFAWDDSKQQYLDKLVPGWEGKSREQTWEETADDLIRFKHSNDRLPSPTASDPDERRLGMFLQAQRDAMSGRKPQLAWDGSREEFLYSYLPGWDQDVQHYGLMPWLRNSIALEKFVDQHSRFPSKRSKDTEERRIGVWLANQRYTLRGAKDRKPLSDGAIAWLDERVPGWRG